MRIKIIFTCLLLALVACTEEKKLTEEEEMMISVFTEIHLIEASVNLNLFSKSGSKIDSYYYQDVLESHGLNNEQFTQLLHKYAENPEYYLFVYDSIITHLHRKKFEVNARIEINKQAELERQKQEEQ